MDLNKLEPQFVKVSKEIGFSYRLEGGATRNGIDETENRLELTLPKQIKLFYSHFNGISVDDPGLTIFAVETLSFDATKRLHFATFDFRHNVYFDASKINVADQWNIVGEDNFLITHTMASFWSNKIWHWLKHRRSVWMEIDW